MAVLERPTADSLDVSPALDSPTPTLTAAALDKNDTLAIEKDDTPAIGPAPDGGARAWLTVLGSFLTIFVQFGLTNTFGVFQGYYEQSLLSSYSASTISWIGGLQQFFIFFGGLFVGRLFDAHGIHVLAIPGSVLLVLSLMMTSLCKEFYQFVLAQGILFGIGSALVFYPAIAAPGQWFSRRRSMAMGIASSSSALGGTVWPIAMNRLITQIGFQWAVRTVGFISLILLTVSCLLMRTRLPRKKPTPWNAMHAPLRQKSFIFLVLSPSLAYFGLYTPFFYITTRAELFGATSTLAFYFPAFINAGSVFGRLMAGLGDYWGNFNVLIGSAAGCAILMLAFWIPLSSIPALIVFAVLFGLVVGLYIAITSPCIAQTGPPSEIGMPVGILWALIAPFSLTGPPINGALIAGYPGKAGYLYSGAFSGVCMVLGVASAVASMMAIKKESRKV